jgi:hypothetical protein
VSFWGFLGREPKDLFLEFSPRESHWRVVTWNFDLAATSVPWPGRRQWTVEVHGAKTKVIHWLRGPGDELQFCEDGKIVRRKRLREPLAEPRSLMNLAIHSTLKYGLEANHEFMLTPVSGATALDIQAETRALQWIQATFATLARALANLRSNPDLLLTAACFSGRVPETGETVLRLIAFNLDIFFYLQADAALLIVVFNDKDQGHGQSKTPAFQQIIKVTKPQFYDEITKLLHQLAQVGEIV